jgi:outer membrane protein assembly factor BamB
MKRSPLLALVLCIGASLPSYAQRGTNWPTHSGDPQRTGWQRNETKITRETVKDLQLLWKLKLDNESKALHSLTEPLILGNIITDRGFKELAIVAGSSDNIYAIDADLGKIFWNRRFEYESGVPKQQQSTWLCPAGLTATPVLSTGGRGADGGGFNARAGGYIISSDGNLHLLNLANGEELMRPLKFIPPNGKPYSLNLIENVLYTTTGQRCGNVPNSVWSVDLNTQNVSSFNSNGGGIWGLAGAAVGTDGTIYAEAGDGAWEPDAGKYSDTLLALSPKDLKLKDWYTPSNREWITKRDLDMNVTPVVFSYKGRDLIVGSGKEGRLFLLDSKSLGGADHRTPLYRTPLISNEEVDFAGRGTWGSLGSWEDERATRWILAPVWGPLHSQMKFPIAHGDAPHGSIAAFKVQEQNGKTVLAPAWVSPDLLIPSPPVIVNGIVFVISSGEYVRQSNDNNGTLWNAQQRAERSTHATLYALDAETGRELWSSGDTVTSFTHFAGLAVANGRVYFTTYDNTVYAFGFPIEH